MPGCCSIASSFATPLVRTVLGSACALLLFADPSALFARDAPDSATVQSGQYVVRPGDTLRGLAERYLGAEERWTEIWQRNRDLIRDPDRLQPGWEIEIHWRGRPRDSVVVSQLWNAVQGWRPPLRWADSRRNDLLRFEDRLQTFADSSAELSFPDSTLLRVNEESMVLLQPTSRLGSTVARRTVELVEGQADLEATSVDPGSSGVQLIIGDATARPEASDSGDTLARVRNDDGEAQLMVYTGTSELEAGGAEIEVEEGMGSTVEKGQAPSPPERLLDAPELLAPAPDARLATARPTFEWSAVEGAAHYTLELCRDRSCGQLDRRLSPLDTRRWQAETKLPIATLYWRVTATSESGLDGYPSDTRELVILDHVEDTIAPETRLQVTPPRLAPRFGLEQHWILGPGARLEAVAEDGQSGVAEWTPLLDGEEVSPEVWQSGPWPVGQEIEASFVAVDRASNEARLEPITFVYDDQAPTLQWGIERQGPRGDVGPPAAALGNLDPASSLRVHELDDPHSLWPWREQRWRVEKDSRQIVIRPNRPVRVEVAGQTLELTPENGLWILGDDAICRSLYRFEYELETSQEGRWPKKRSLLTLRVRAIDWVTNRVEGELKIESVGRGQRQPSAERP